MIVAATQSFVTRGRRHVRVGEMFDADHELVRRLPDLFEPVEGIAHDPAPVETASAAPGERRSATTRRRAKAVDGDA